MTIDDLGDAFYILSTGKYLDNWGSYGSCVESTNGGHFWMASVTGELKPSDPTEGSPSATFRTGLCVPPDCIKSDLRALDNIFI